MVGVSAGVISGLLVPDAQLLCPLPQLDPVSRTVKSHYCHTLKTINTAGVQRHRREREREREKERERERDRERRVERDREKETQREK